MSVFLFVCFFAFVYLNFTTFQADHLNSKNFPFSLNVDYTVFGWVPGHLTG